MGLRKGSVPSTAKLPAPPPPPKSRRAQLLEVMHALAAQKGKAAEPKITLPAVVVENFEIVRVFWTDHNFGYPDGTEIPAGWTQIWSAKEFAEACPGWTILRLIDEPPSPTSTRAPETEWRFEKGACRVVYVEPTP